MEPRRILIVEDELQLRSEITFALLTCGYEVVAAENGRDGLRMLIDAHYAGTAFDLLICDVQMAEIDCEQLLAKLFTLNLMVPVLIMTEATDRECIVRFMLSGCRGCIEKPFEPESLCRQVAKLFNGTAGNAPRTKNMKQLIALGERAAQIVHDFNNILGGIIGYADMARELVAPNHPAAMKIEKILATADRGTRLCSNALMSFRNETLQTRETAEMNDIVRDAGVFLTDIAPENITVSVESTAEPVLLTVDTGRLKQALLNLGFNAFASMAGGGHLSLTLREKSAIEASSVSCKGRWVVVSVKDSGTGLSSEQVPQIFKRGYTTRNGSSGFGLSIVQQIVERDHQGWISVESEPGRGSTFNLWLPKDSRSKIPKDMQGSDKTFFHS